MVRSTPAVASIEGRYLFQSCVRASDGGVEGTGTGPDVRVLAGVAWIGI